MDLQLARRVKKFHNVDDENIRKCLTISEALGEIGNRGNHNTVTSILNSEYYKCLSEDYKEKVFRSFTYSRSGGRCSTSAGTNGLDKVAERDMPTYIKQILPYMPLHKFQSCSLPPGLPWIESEEWMRDMLVKHKVRWDLDSNADNNESVLQKASDKGDKTMVKNDEDVIKESVTNRDTIQKLRDLAFTMMAAELFYICCDKKAIRCCRYLLGIAPNLVTINAGHYKTVALCTAFISDSLDVINLLQKQQAPIGNIARAAHVVFMHSRNLGSFPFISNALKRKETRDEVRLFRDEEGNTILHLLFRTVFIISRDDWYLKNKLTAYVHSCIQPMLDFGVDPRMMNDANETALDVLIDAYVPRFRFHTANFTELFLQNLERILPYWGVALPSGFPRRPKTLEDRIIMLCNIAELLLNDEHAFKFFMYSMQERDLYCWCESTNCQLCLPYVSLFYHAMCKGIDMHRISGESLRPSVWELSCKDYVSYLLRTSAETDPNSCCHWALLELLVHCGSDAFSHMAMEDYGDHLYSPVEVVSESLTELADSWLKDKSESHLEPIRRIMSMLSMYAPSILHGVLPQLLAYCTTYGKSEDEYDEEEEEEEVVENGLMKTITQMQEKIESVVRPLKLLCRITIRASVAFKDIEKLSYPGKLKCYLRIGDIPESHVIHQIIKEIEVTG